MTKSQVIRQSFGRTEIRSITAVPAAMNFDNLHLNEFILLLKLHQPVEVLLKQAYRVTLKRVLNSSE